MRGVESSKVLALNPAKAISAIEKNLDGLQRLTSWVIALMFVLWVGGILNAQEITVVGTKLPTALAFLAGVLFYLLALGGIVLGFWRIMRLVESLSDKQNAKDVVVALALHPWILNPFSFFGQGRLNSFLGGLGYGLLLPIWWLCGASIALLVPKLAVDSTRSSDIWYWPFFIAFLVLGLLAIFIINRTASGLAGKIEKEPFYDEMVSHRYWRYGAVWLGSLIGFAIAIVSVSLRG